MDEQTPLVARDSAPVELATRIRQPADFGGVVRRYRESRRLDQATTAGLAGVGLRFLGELERGKATLRVGLVLQVLERLGFEIWIRPRTVRTPPPRPPQR